MLRFVAVCLLLFTSPISAQSQTLIKDIPTFDSLTFDDLRAHALSKGLSIKSIEREYPDINASNPFEKKRKQQAQTQAIYDRINRHAVTYKPLEHIKFDTALNFCKYDFENALLVVKVPYLIRNVRGSDVSPGMRGMWWAQYASVKPNYGAWGKASTSINCLNMPQYALLSDGISHDMRAQISIKMSPDDAELLYATTQDGFYPVMTMVCINMSFRPADDTSSCLVSDILLRLHGSDRRYIYSNEGYGFWTQK